MVLFSFNPWIEVFIMFYIYYLQYLVLWFTKKSISKTIDIATLSLPNRTYSSYTIAITSFINIPVYNLLLSAI